MSDDRIAQIERRRPRTRDQLNHTWCGYHNQQPQHYDSTCYHGVNLHNVWHRGTVEYRWFEGTRHAGKEKAYVQLVLAVAAKAFNGWVASSRKRSLNPQSARRCVPRVLIRKPTLDGRSLEGGGEIFTRATVTEMVLAMVRDYALFDQRDTEDYIDTVLRNAKMLSGVELTVRGDMPEEQAASLLYALTKHGLAEVSVAASSRHPPESRFCRFRKRTSWLSGPPIRSPTRPHKRTSWLACLIPSPLTSSRRSRAQVRSGVLCMGSFLPSTIPETAFRLLTGWRGCHPGGPCLYRCVMVSV